MSSNRDENADFRKRSPGEARAVPEISLLRLHSCSITLGTSCYGFDGTQNYKGARKVGLSNETDDKVEIEVSTLLTSFRSTI